jgi:antitoxin component YwqK of YwqJK toxin-antitoxin module
MQNNDDGQERIKFVTICETGDPGFIAFTKSLLESEGIIYYFKGEGLQELAGMGRAGIGYNQVFGPVEIQVDEKDAEKARELLDQAQQSTFNTPEDIEDEKTEKFEKKEYLNPLPEKNKTSYKDIYMGIMAGIILTIIIGGVLNYWQGYKEKNLSWISERDGNNDGKPDVFYSYKEGQIVKIESDRNFDGGIDQTCFFKNGIIDRCESDDNFNRIFHTNSYFKNSVISRAETYFRNEKDPRIVEYYECGIINEAEYYNESMQKIWKKALYKDGIISEELIDQNEDGKFDLSMRYDRWGRLKNVSHLTGVK